MSNDEELSRTAKRLDYAELFDRVRKMKENFDANRERYGEQPSGSPGSFVAACDQRFVKTDRAEISA